MGRGRRGPQPSRRARLQTRRVAEADEDHGVPLLRRPQKTDRERLQPRGHKDDERDGRRLRRRLHHPETHPEMDRGREGPHGLGTPVPRIHQQAGLRGILNRNDVMVC